ncbi:Uncharacterized protein Rs2_50300 [Raphanus sativus]|nr:Uncharacterized protein Rs2_50300 [Raphanus sativus]
MPSSFSTWSWLYRLDITGCTNIKDFPDVPDSIVELVLSCTGIEELFTGILTLSAPGNYNQTSTFTTFFRYVYRRRLSPLQYHYFSEVIVWKLFQIASEVYRN